MAKFYAFSTSGFYDDGLNAVVPGDAVEITQELYTELLNGQGDGTKVIVEGADGLPELQDIPQLETYTYPAKTITLPFLSGWSKTLPERVFTKTTLEQARIDKLAAVEADRDALLQYSDLVAKEGASKVADSQKILQPNLQWTHQLRSPFLENAEADLAALNTIDDVLAYEADFDPKPLQASYVVLTMRQFALAAVNSELMDYTTAADFLESKVIPAGIEAVLSTLPTADANNARLTLKAMTLIPRDDAMVSALFGAAFGMTSQQLDDFFLAAFEV
jgi:hypothetical protein